MRRRDRQTDGHTPDRYITLSARLGQRNNNIKRESTASTVDTLLVPPGSIAICWSVVRVVYRLKVQLLDFDLRSEWR